MMTCRELMDFLMDYDEGALPDAEQKSFDDHLQICPDCVQYLHSYRATVKLGQSICPTSDEIPAEVPEDLVQTILNARNTDA